MKKPMIARKLITTGLFVAAGLVVNPIQSSAAPGTDSQTSDNASQSSASSSTSRRASSFIKEADQGNRAEVALAEIATQKAQNAEIKQLAQQLIQDHQQADQKLQTIAQAHNVTLDRELPASKKRLQNRLQDLSGAEFDKQYATAMLKDHHEDIQKYQKAANDVQESDVKEYAQETLQKLQQHLQHAVTAARAVGVDQSTISSYSQDIGMGGSQGKQESTSGSSHQHE